MSDAVFRFNNATIGASPVNFEADLLTSDNQRNQTRKEIVALLDKRADEALDLTQPDESAAGLRVAPPPIAKGELAALRPEGLGGVSLISVFNSDLQDPVEWLDTWQGLAADEVILVDLGTSDAAPLTGETALWIVRSEGPDPLTPAEAYNLGLRLSSFDRLVLASPGLQIPADLAERNGDAWQVWTGAADLSAFFLSIERRRIAAVGGFNEYLARPEGALEDLASRLLLAGHIGIGADAPSDRESAPPARLAVQDGVSLRETLAADPEYPAITNRYLAALMPKWRGTGSKSVQIRHVEGNRVHLMPRAAQTATVPPHLQSAAQTYALTELLAKRTSEQAFHLPPDRLGVLLDKPAAEIGAIDIALATKAQLIGKAAGKGWLVLDFSRFDGEIPTEVISWIESAALDRGLQTVLRLTRSQGAAFGPALSQDDPIGTLATLDLRGLYFGKTMLSGQDRLLVMDAEAVDDARTIATRGPAVLLRVPKLFIDVQHGLGNRIRAIGSAAAIAEATGRELVVVWQRDPHCECNFEDLFVPGVATMDQSFAQDATAMGMEFVNYMEVEPGSTKDSPISPGLLRDLYVRSAYPLANPHSTWQSENLHIQRLLRPRPEILDLAGGTGAPASLAVHIRMQGGPGFENLPYEAAANWTPAAHAEIAHWRELCHYSRFIPRIDALIDEGLAESIYVASDTTEAIYKLAERYGTRVRWMDRPANDRSKVTLAYALAEAIVLSRSPMLLGSYFSSFSELAMRLARSPIRLELAGRDF
ncbi:hypothetical protein GC209_10715 [bacterium]|nr:hypothetical protein [bacterium]